VLDKLRINERHGKGYESTHNMTLKKLKRKTSCKGKDKMD